MLESAMILCIHVLATKTLNFVSHQCQGRLYMYVRATARAFTRAPFTRDAALCSGGKAHVDDHGGGYSAAPRIVL